MIWTRINNMKTFLHCLKFREYTNIDLFRKKNLGKAFGSRQSHDSFSLLFLLLKTHVSSSWRHLELDRLRIFTAIKFIAVIEAVVVSITSFWNMDAKSIVTAPLAIRQTPRNSFASKCFEMLQDFLAHKFKCPNLLERIDSNWDAVLRVCTTKPSTSSRVFRFWSPPTDGDNFF